MDRPPGYKSYNLKVVDIKSGEKASIVQIIFRNILGLISLITREYHLVIGSF